MNFADSQDEYLKLDGDQDFKKLSPTSDQIGTVKRRWFMLFLFCMLAMLISAVQYAFAGGQHTSEEFFGKSSFFIQSLVLIYVVAGLAATPLGIYTMDRWGLEVSINIGSVILLVACIMRYFACLREDHISYWTVLAAHFLGGVAQIFVINSSTRMAMNWFPESERGLATGLGALFGILGQGLGFALFSAVVDNDKDNFPTVMLINLISAIVLMILVFIFFKDAPDKAPNMAVLLRRTTTPAENVTFFGEFKKLTRNKNFMILFAGFGVGYGSIVAFTATLSQVVKPDGYSNNDASNFGTALIGTGVVGAVISGILVDITRRYKLTAQIFGTGAIGAIIWFALALNPGHSTQLYLSQALFGFTLIGLVPCALEFAVEITYPISEIYSSSLLNLVGQLLAIPITVIINVVQNNSSNKSAVWFIVGLFCFCIIAIFFTKADYRRKAHEAEQHGLTVNEKTNSHSLGQTIA